MGIDKSKILAVALLLMIVPAVSATTEFNTYSPNENENVTYLGGMDPNNLGAVINMSIITDDYSGDLIGRIYAAPVGYNNPDINIYEENITGDGTENFLYDGDGTYNFDELQALESPTNALNPGSYEIRSSIINGTNGNNIIGGPDTTFNINMPWVSQGGETPSDGTNVGPAPQDVFVEADVSSDEDGTAYLYIEDSDDTILVDSKPIGEQTTEFTNGTVNDLERGTYEIYAEVDFNDYSNNSSTPEDDRTTFTVSEETPDWSNFEPPAGYTYDYPTAVTNDNVNISVDFQHPNTGEVRLYVDGDQKNSWQYDSGGTTQSYKFNWVDAIVGSHSYYWNFISDATGDSYSTSTRNFDIEDINLNITRIYPEDGENIGPGPRDVNLTWEIESNGPFEFHQYFNEYSGGTSYINHEAGTTTYNNLETQMPIGTYDWGISGFYPKGDGTDESRGTNQHSFTIGEAPYYNIEPIYPEPGANYSYLWGQNSFYDFNATVEESATLKVKVNGVELDNGTFTHPGDNITSNFDVSGPVHTIGEHYWTVNVIINDSIYSSPTWYYTITEPNLDIQFIEPENNETIGSVLEGETDRFHFDVDTCADVNSSVYVTINGESVDSYVLEEMSCQHWVSDYNLGPGNHTLSITMEPDNSDYNSNTESINFTIERWKGGILGEIAYDSIGQILGTEGQANLAVVAMIFIMMAAMGVAWAGGGAAGSILGIIVSTSIFAYIRYLPSWLFFPIVLIGGFILARLVLSQGRD